MTFNTNFDILRSVQMTWTRHKSMGTQWQTLHIRFLYSSQLTLSPTLYIIYICIVWYCYGALLRTSPMNTYVKVSFRLWSFKFGGPKLVNIYAWIMSFELFKDILSAWVSCLFIKYLYFDLGQKIFKTNFDLPKWKFNNLADNE